MLKPIPLARKTVSEGWLQKLLFEHPELIPAEEIEPLFRELIPVARELRTGAGALDLLYMTPEGWLVLAETKLWRNPEARRSVVAQLIDYANAMAQWSYTDLSDAVGKARGDTGADPLIELVREDNEDDFDESRFVDTASRNLRLGRFLLLIIGDGIREDVEQMAEYLGQAPQLGFTLGLVEMTLYRSDHAKAGEFYVQPRIVTRTREVTRAVVEIREGVKREDVTVTIPEVKTPANGGRHILTEEEFFDHLSRNADADVVEFARWMFDQAKVAGLTIAWGVAGPMIKYVYEDTGDYFTLGQFGKGGYLRGTRWILHMVNKLVS